MRAKMADESKGAKQSLTRFFLLAFLFSWVVEAPLALKAQGIWRPSLPFAAHYLAGYGPLAAAVVLTAKDEGRRGLRRLAQRMFRWRVPRIWWPVAFSPLLFYLLLAAVLWLAQGEPPAVGALGRLKFLPDLGLAAVPLWVATFGLGEETGWRGYALPRLQRRRSALSATVILWFFWALWHLPLFFYAYDAGVLFGFLPGLLAGAIIFTWIYNSTESVLIAAVWHGTFNLTTACVSCGAGIGAAAVSAAVMVGAVILVAAYKAPALSPATKRTA